MPRAVSMRDARPRMARVGWRNWLGSTAVSARVRDPKKRAKRNAWDRYRVAMEGLDDARRAFASAPNDGTAERVRHAEIEYADAIAIAGEFEVMNLSWEVAWSWENE
jgi:hypothetical protein